MEVLEFFPFTATPHSIYLLSTVFEVTVDGLLATADNFILMQLDALLVNIGPSKAELMQPILLLANVQIVPQVKISLE